MNKLKKIAATIATMYLGCGLLVAFLFSLFIDTPFCDWGFEEWKFVAGAGVFWPVMVFMAIIFAVAAMGQM